MTSSTMHHDSIATAGPSRPPRHLNPSLHTLRPELIIIGAGIAGSALSYALSHTGRSVLLIERDLSEPDRIVGELLQPGGVAALAKLGLEACLDGIDAVPVEGYAVVSGERVVEVAYPVLEAMAGQVGGVEASESGVEDSERRMSLRRRNKVESGDDDGKIANGHGDLRDDHSANGVSNGHSNGHANGHESTSNVSRISNGHNPTKSVSSPWHVPSTSGKKEGRSFHHGRLISALRHRCLTDAPNLDVIEGTVRDLVYCGDSSRVIGVSVAIKRLGDTEADEDETIVSNIYAPVTIVADGCFSKFRSIPGSRIPKSRTRSHFVGAVIQDVELPIPHMGAGCLTPAGPVLLYQIGDKARETRLLVDVKGKLPNVADGSLKQHLLDNYIPFLPRKVQPAIIKSLESQRLRTMPNSFLPPSMQGRANSLSGVIMVGDAWNMRHPLTGGGMSVAFSDAVMLTEYLRPSEKLPAGRAGLEDWDVIAHSLREWFWRRKGLTGVVNVLSMALYEIFGSDAPGIDVLREGCFRYFERGGESIAGPVGLLGALTPRPVVLFYHFFYVALYSIYVLFTSGPPARDGKQHTPTILDWPGYSLLSAQVFWTACVVFLPLMWTEFKV